LHAKRLVKERITSKKERGMKPGGEREGQRAGERELKGRRRDCPPSLKIRAVPGEKPAELVYHSKKQRERDIEDKGRVLAPSPKDP